MAGHARAKDLGTHPNLQLLAPSSGVFLAGVPGGVFLLHNQASCSSPTHPHIASAPLQVLNTHGADSVKHVWVHNATHTLP